MRVRLHAAKRIRAENAGGGGGRGGGGERFWTRSDCKLTADGGCQVCWGGWRWVWSASGLGGVVGGGAGILASLPMLRPIRLLRLRLRAFGEGDELGARGIEAG